MHKSHIAVVALLLCASVTGYAADSQSKEPSSLLATFSARENSFWTVFQKKDIEGFKKMVTDDYLNIDYAGDIATASEFAAAISDFNVTDFKLSDFRLIQPTPTTAIVVYHTRLHFTYKGTPGSGDLISSTVWVKRKGHWVASHYQETSVQQQ